MMDKAWVHLIRTSKEYKDGAKRFVNEAALRKQSDIITCPCGDCQNLFRHTTSVVYEHLVIKGMDKSYTTWVLHGEEISSRENRNETSETYKLCRTLYEEDHHQVQDDSHLESFKDREDEEFRELLGDAECPLFPGCEKHTKLSATIILYKIKVQFGLSNKCFTTLLEAVRDLLPRENTLPSSKYSAEKLIKDFQLEDEEIHACVNDCCLFRKELKDRVTCPTCSSSRWKIDERSSEIREGVPAKVLRYFPIIPRFKRMFGSLDMAKQLIWHSNNKSNDGNMRHPVDSKAWEEIDTKWPSFGEEPRNLRLGLAADGINPYRQLNSRHSCWPVMLVIYNLPPWMCMKDKQILLSLLIPGPKQPGNDICIYLQPLIDDLLLLWNDGVQVYDAFKNSLFTLKAILMWTVNDFLAYGNLAGCTTKGKTACPICGNNTMSQWLSDSRKTVYLCNRCFLELTHPFRMKKSWFDGTIEDRERPTPLTGEEIYEEVKDIKNEWGKGKKERKRKKKGQVLQMWKKMSGFFQLPYWKDLVLRHNLDVMHIEKNVCESILSILLNVDGIYPSSAPYTLSKTEKKTFCKRLFDLKLPDSFSSNISRRVVVDDCKILGLKSHDCHVLMQQILPVMLRGLLPKGPRTAIYRLCAFFNALTQKVINKERMKDLEKEVAEILCIFERYFPHSFFDVMVHLLHHLPEEARLCGPVSDRWMYGFERYMKILKGYVKNPARPEGCIVKCYLADETLKFCSKYIRQAAEMDESFGRNDDYENDLILEGRPISASSPITLSEEKLRIAHRYILLNTTEVAPYVEAHLRELKRIDKRFLTNERMLWQKHSSSFPTWLKEKVNFLPVSIKLKMIESSRQASKRAKMQRNAFLAAIRNNQNKGVHITKRHLNQPTRSRNLLVQDTSNASSQDCDNGVSNCDSGKGKSVRGPTKCNSLRKGGKNEIMFNEKGQPIGPGSEQLSSYAGALAREMISILYDDWRKVPGSHKDYIWEIIKGKFFLDDERRNYVIKMVGKLWRTHKSRLRGIASTRKKEQLRTLKPEGSTQVEWDIFLKRRLSKEFQEKSARFKSMRKNQDLPYTGSRMGYARMEEKMRKESVDPTSITRADVWCAGHTKSNGEASNERVANCLDKIQEFNATSSNSNVGSIREDALAHVLGPERRGAPRGVGFGVTLAALEASTRRNAKETRLEERVESMSNNIERMTAIIMNQKTLIDSLHTKLMEYERQGDQLNNLGHEGHTFTSQVDGDDVDIQRVEQENFAPHEIETVRGANCKLIDWIKGDGVVAIARWVTSDPNTLLHCKPLGKNSSKVWVVKAEKPLAPLWRSPNSEINNMKEAEGTTIAWPTDHILMEEPAIF